MTKRSTSSEVDALEAASGIALARMERELDVAAWACGHPPTSATVIRELRVYATEFEHAEARAMIVPIIDRAHRGAIMPPAAVLACEARANLIEAGELAEPGSFAEYVGAITEAKLCDLYADRHASRCEDIVDMPAAHLGAIDSGLRDAIQQLREVLADIDAIAASELYARKIRAKYLNNGVDITSALKEAA